MEIFREVLVQAELGLSLIVRRGPNLATGKRPSMTSLVASKTTLGLHFVYNAN